MTEADRLRYVRALGIPRLEGERAMLAGQVRRSERQAKIRRKKLEKFSRIFFGLIFWTAIFAGIGVAGHFLG